MLVRPAEERDLPEILEILNREIREGVAHFGTEEMSLERLKAEFESAKGRFPWFVAVEEDQAEPNAPSHLTHHTSQGAPLTSSPHPIITSSSLVLGVARASPWKARGSYSWTAEIGIYVRPEHQGKGIGKAIYRAFFPALEASGLRTVLGGIGLPNEPSVRLHEAFGMRHVGTLPKAGFKLGKWHDVGYWAINFEGPDPPTQL